MPARNAVRPELVAERDQLPVCSNEGVGGWQWRCDWVCPVYALTVPWCADCALLCARVWQSTAGHAAALAPLRRSESRRAPGSPVLHARGSERALISAMVCGCLGVLLCAPCVRSGVCTAMSGSTSREEAACVATATTDNTVRWRHAGTLPRSYTHSHRHRLHRSSWRVTMWRCFQPMPQPSAHTTPTQ
jgi:hypothetical protein